MVMRNTIDFFEEQKAQCRALAARAANKTDREFWLRLARVVGLLQAKQRGALKVEVPTVRFERPIFKKRGVPPNMTQTLIRNGYIHVRQSDRRPSIRLFCAGLCQPSHDD